MKGQERQFVVLKIIVDIFIETGEPASSLAVCERLNKTVSSATIRNDMVKLEKLGFLEQPHTSAGRIPTYKGFRFYINSLMEPQSLTKKEMESIDEILNEDLSSVSAIVENAALALSEYTKLLVVSTTSVPKFFVISKVDVIRTGRRIYAVLIVASSGEVKNKICRLKFDIEEKELEFFKEIINESLVGNSIETIDKNLMEKIAVALGSYVLGLTPLLNALYDISQEILKREVNLKGEQNLLKYGGLEAKELMEFITAKNKIEDVLNGAFSGINIKFGNEDNSFCLENSSLIVANYGGDEPFGSFGVVGPIRLDYKKILPYVSYFSQKISSLIEEVQREIKGGDGCEETAKEK